MQDLIKKQSAKVGLPPGTLIHIGEQYVERERVYAMVYDGERCEERELSTVADCREWLARPGVKWIDVDGVHDVNFIRELGELAGLHPLALEDIVNTNQRPKADDYGDVIFIVAKMLYYDAGEDEITTDQVSIVLGRNFVLSFSEAVGDEFASVREQIRKSSGRIRALGADFLAYRLLDSVVDGYFSIGEMLGERVERLEDELLTDRRRNFLPELHNLKRELLVTRAVVSPARDLVGAALEMRTPLITADTKIYLRDVHDHVMNVLDMIETLRDAGAGNLDIYLSSIQYRQNDVVRVLTLISTIFLPLTFMVGVWGMNFEYMPEIDEPWGYFAALALMAICAGGMLIFFKIRRWL